MKPIICLAAFAIVAFGQTTDEAQPTQDAAAAQKAVHERANQKIQSMMKRLDVARLSPQVFNSTFGTVVVQTIRMPSSWNLDTKTCPALKSTLHGKGEDKNTITVTQNTDGTFNIESVDQVTGTANDDLGNQYIFLYENRSTVDSSTSLITQPNPPFDFHGPDTFQLLGVNGATGYSVAQYFRLHVNADGSATDMGSAASGNPGCDPI